MELLEENPTVLAQFAAGELDAFEALFRQFQGEVYGWIVRVVRDSSAAEDLTVETFWRVYRARARFEPHRSFGAWARKIATNVAIDYLKTHRHQERELLVSVDAEAVPDNRVGIPALQSSSIQNPAIRREIRERTQLAFQQLPAKLQAVATLALIEDCPHAEIAEALDISTAAVKSRLFRAVRILRKKLGNLDTTHE